MDIRSKLKEHLINYRSKHDLTKAEMAVDIGVSERTYNDIEVFGEIKKVQILLTIIEKTGFAPMQEIAGSPPTEKEIELSDKLIDKLESDVGRLSSENNRLNNENNRLTQENSRLIDQVKIAESKKVSPLRKTGTGKS